MSSVAERVVFSQEELVESVLNDGNLDCFYPHLKRERLVYHRHSNINDGNVIPLFTIR